MFEPGYKSPLPNIRGPATGLAEAQTLLYLAKGHPALPCKVIDDGCHERAEVVLKLGLEYGLDPGLLRRAFVFNSEYGRFLKMQKPLAENGILQRWFKEQRDNNRLHPGSIFRAGVSEFKVDDYGALRASSMSSIYLDDNPIATWGVGHVAVMVGDYIVDTGIERPLPFNDWQAMMQLPGLIPMLGELRKLPEIHIAALDADAVNKVFTVFEHLQIRVDCEDNLEVQKNAINQCLLSLREHERGVFYNVLFAQQIEKGGLYQRDHWSDIYPGPLSSRGENPDIFCPMKRQNIIATFADQSVRERLDGGLAVLRPFKDYENMVLGGEFVWEAAS